MQHDTLTEDDLTSHWKFPLISSKSKENLPKSLANLWRGSSKMVTCQVDTVAVPKMNSVRIRKPSSSNSSGFRLLDGDHLESSSSVSRNSVYKLKIDLMFDDTR